jgi:hypothetical protein
MEEKPREEKPREETKETTTATATTTAAAAAKDESKDVKNHPTSSKYKSFFTHPPSEMDEINFSIIDKMLETEKQHNKTETWNKLDRTVKKQKLHSYAEKYGRENNLPVKEIKVLKTFFTATLDKGKLSKTKEVLYDKVSREVESVPGLQFNMVTKGYTLKNMDTKRVSTLKSLTPQNPTEMQPPS